MAGPRDLPELPERLPRRDIDPDHVAEHRRADLNADAGEEPGQRRSWEKVGEESEPEDAGQRQKAGGH